MPLFMGRHRWLVALGGFFSRAVRLLGRFSHPFRAAGKHVWGVGRAWGLRGRKPLSAVRTRTGEGGGRVQSHRAPKPGGRTQSGGGARGEGSEGVAVRVCVGGWARGSLFIISYYDGAGVKYKGCYGKFHPHEIGWENSAFGRERALDSGERGQLCPTPTRR
jgi:hypothetical protein